MKPRTCTLSLITLSAAALLGTAAFAGDLPKEGTFKGNYAGAGVVKVLPIGKDNVLILFDETGLSVGSGIVDYLTWRCIGQYDILNGTVQPGHIYCIATDPAGDQIGSDGAGEKRPADAKSFSGKLTFTAGSGKYAGISGALAFTCDSPGFKVAAEGTFVDHCTNQGSYKLP